MDENQELVTITVTLSANQADAFSQFLKRVGHSDYKSLSANEAELYEMLSAGERIRYSLAEAGYAPR